MNKFPKYFYFSPLFLVSHNSLKYSSFRLKFSKFRLYSKRKFGGDFLLFFYIKLKAKDSKLSPHPRSFPQPWQALQAELQLFLESLSVELK